MDTTLMQDRIETLIRSAELFQGAAIHGDTSNYVDIEFRTSYEALEFARDFDIEERGSFEVAFMNPPRNLNHPVVLTFTYARKDG